MKIVNIELIQIDWSGPYQLEDLNSLQNEVTDY